MSLRSRLYSLVLTGSLARDEATILKRGAIKTLVGDADFLVVLQSNAADPSYAELGKLERSIEKLLFEIGIHSHIGLGTVYPSYFDQLQPRSFSYELKHSGAVIWGDPHVLDRIPQYHPALLSREDAWRTLNHRIIEVLGAFASAEPTANHLPADLEYTLTKLYLDMATSYLIFAGRYQPTYHARSTELRAVLFETGHLDPWPAHGSRVVQRISQCTNRKMFDTNVGIIHSFHCLDEAVTFARQLWLWEALILSDSPQSLPIRSLIVSLARRQVLAEHLRAWSSFLRRNRWHSLSSSFTRWARLFPIATPRYLLYGAAFQLFCEIPAILRNPSASNPALLRNANELLPALPPETPRLTDWHSLSRAIIYGYRTFLLGTSA